MNEEEKRARAFVAMLQKAEMDKLAQKQRMVDLQERARRDAERMRSLYHGMSDITSVARPFSPPEIYKRPRSLLRWIIAVFIIGILIAIFIGGEVESRKPPEQTQERVIYP